MRSFISNFKALFLASLVILFIEIILYFSHVSNANFTSNILPLAFQNSGNMQRIVMNDKLDAFKNVSAEFVQVGDSSGLFGVMPSIVMEYLKQQKYLNYSCCADTGWDGYYYIAKNALDNNTKAKYLILHVTPYAFPLLYKEGFSSILYDALVSPQHYLYKYLPSMAFRLDITNSIYYGKFKHTILKEEAYLKKYREMLPTTLGWLPLTSNGVIASDIPPDDCKFDNYFDANNKSTVYQQLRKLKKLANNHKVKLIIIFSPVACQNNDNLKPIVNDIARFSKRYPDVYIPFPLVTTYELNHFHDRFHMNDKGAFKHSHEVGRALAKL